MSQKIDKFWHLLVAPHPSIVQEDTQRQARIISGLGIIIFLALLLGTVAAFSRADNVETLLLTAGMMLVLYVMSRTRYVVLAGMLMLLITTLPSFIFFIETSTLTEGMSLYAGAIWLALPIVIGGLILPVRGTVIVNILILSIFLAIKLFIAPGLNSPEFWNSFSFLFVLSVVMTLTLQVREVYLVKPQIDKLLRANQVKDEFLATMSHELRTPLNSVIGYSSILLTGIGGEIDADAEKYIRKIAASSDSLLELITDILDISRIEAGEVDITLQSVSIHDLQKSWQNTFAPLAQNKGIAFDIQLSNDLPGYIQTDPTRITQIVTNLVTNAIKFTDQGHVSLKIRNHNKHLALVVEDTGIGIPEDYIATIFDRFSQVESSYNRKYQGTGLGLAITRQLVALFGGNIQVQSILNQGSIFTVTLPI